jgi:hypothetical protein
MNCGTAMAYIEHRNVILKSQMLDVGDTALSAIGTEPGSNPCSSQACDVVSVRTSKTSNSPPTPPASPYPFRFCPLVLMQWRLCLVYSKRVVVSCIKLVTCETIPPDIIFESPSQDTIIISQGPGQSILKSKIDHFTGGLAHDNWGR